MLNRAVEAGTRHGGCGVGVFKDTGIREEELTDKVRMDLHVGVGSVEAHPNS